MSTDAIDFRDFIAVPVDAGIRRALASQVLDCLRARDPAAHVADVSGR